MKLLAAIALAVSICFATAAFAAAAPADIIIPETIDGLPAVANGAQQLPLDYHKNFSADGESVTIYVFRATYPNAALWFERAEAILKQTWAARGLGQGEAATSFVFAGSPTPNGLRRTFAVNGAYKSTALSVIQIGQWILKIRSSSMSLDVAGQNIRLDKIIDALKTLNPVKSSHPLDLPGPCAAGSRTGLDSLGGKVITRPKGEEILLAGTVALTAAQEASGAEKSLAADPGNFCRDTLAQNDEIAALYRPRDETNKSWVILLADSGRSLSGRPIPVLDERRAGGRGILTANKLEQLDVILLTENGLPLPEASIAVGFNHIVRGGAVLAAVEYGTTNISVSRLD